MGIIAHHLHEQVLTGAFGRVDPVDRRRVLDAAWDAEVADWHARLIEAWAPIDPPAPDAWPGIAMTRARLLRRLASGVEWPTGDGVEVPRQERGHRPAISEGAPAMPQSELHLEDAAARLRGVIDRLEMGLLGIRVVDLKSGMLQGDATVDQRRQLLLYADLVRASYGTLPVELVIEDISGRQRPLQFTSDDVEEAVDDVRAAALSYNAAVDAGQDPQLRASPSPETCEPCNQRLACRPYWENLESSWGHGSVLGEVQSMSVSAGGRTLRLDTVSPLDRAGTTSWAHGSALEGVTQGSIAVVDCEASTDGTTYRARWYSRVISA